MKQPKTETDKLKRGCGLKTTIGICGRKGYFCSGCKQEVGMYIHTPKKLTKIEQAQTQTKLECLKDELEFLEMLFRIDGSGLEEIYDKISQIQQEIKSIEDKR